MPDEAIYMRLAIEEAGDRRPEDDRPHPKVGVGVVKNGSSLAKAHRGEMGNGEHAKFVALERKLNHQVIATPQSTPPWSLVINAIPPRLPARLALRSVASNVLSSE